MVDAPAVIGIGIDVGGTKILSGAVDPSGRVLAEARVPSPVRPEDLLPALSASISEVLNELGDADAPVRGLGLAMPGLVDRAGVLHAAPNLGAAEHGLDLAGELGEALAQVVGASRHSDGAPVKVAFENDATCAAYAECFCGAAHDVDDALVVSIGTGIGAGLIVDGELLRGAHAFAGEIGHMIVERDGEPCPCGRRGCWERYASGIGLALLGQRALHGARATMMRDLVADGGELSGEHVTEAAYRGDAVALAVMQEYATWIALGLSNAVELLDPARLVIGGGLVKEADLFLDLTRQAFEEICRPAQGRHGSDIVLATLGEHAACIGAALIGLEAAEGR